MDSWKKLQRQLVAQQWWVRTCCYVVVGVTVLSLFLSMFGTNSAHVRSSGLIAFKHDNSTTSILGRHVERLRDAGNKFVSTFWSWGDPYDDELLEEWSEESSAETDWEQSAGGDWVPDEVNQEATWDNPDGTWAADQAEWPITAEADQQWTGQEANWEQNAAELDQPAALWDNQDAVLAGEQAEWSESVDQGDEGTLLEPAQDGNWAEQVEPAEQWDSAEAGWTEDQAQWEEPARQWDDSDGSWEGDQLEIGEVASTQNWDIEEPNRAEEQAEWTEPAEQWQIWEEDQAGLEKPTQDWDDNEEPAPALDTQEPHWTEEQAEWTEPAEQRDSEAAQWEEDQAGLVEGGKDWEEDQAGWVEPSEQWEVQNPDWAGAGAESIVTGQAEDASSSSETSGDKWLTQDMLMSTDDTAQQNQAESWGEYASAGDQPDNAWESADSTASSWKATFSGQDSWTAEAAALEASEEGSNDVPAYEERAWEEGASQPQENP